MPFDAIFRAEGYVPTLEELLADVGAAVPEEIGERIKEICRALYAREKENGSLYLVQRHAGTIHEFIVCDSSQFPQSLVRLGYGNCALTIADDYTPDVFFLIFKDKVPPQYFDIIAAHEVTELHESRRCDQQVDGHLAGCRAELLEAERKGLKKEYLRFVRKEYPEKHRQLKRLDDAAKP